MSGESYTLPSFVNRSANPENPVPGEYWALDMISKVREMNPTAKLIPYSSTYYAAVSQYNIGVKNGTIRPSVPEWFCGGVDERTGMLVNSELSDDMETRSGGDVVSRSGSTFDDSSEYPWDECVVNGGSPGSPEYVNCLLGEDAGFDVRWDDFYVDESASDGGGLTSTEEKCRQWTLDGTMNWCYGPEMTSEKADIDLGVGVTSTSKMRLSIEVGKVSGISSVSLGVCIDYGGGLWKCGKVDDIPINSTFKSLRDIKEGKHGWDPSGLRTGNRFKAFVWNGRHRSKIENGVFS